MPIPSSQIQPFPIELFTLVDIEACAKAMTNGSRTGKPRRPTTAAGQVLQDACIERGICRLDRWTDVKYHCGAVPDRFLKRWWVWEVHQQYLVEGLERTFWPQNAQVALQMWYDYSQGYHAASGDMSSVLFAYWNASPRYRLPPYAVALLGCAISNPATIFGPHSSARIRLRKRLLFTLHKHGALPWAPPVRFGS